MDGFEVLRGYNQEGGVFMRLHSSFLGNISGIGWYRDSNNRHGVMFPGKSTVVSKVQSAIVLNSDPTDRTVTVSQCAFVFDGALPTVMKQVS